MIQTQISVLRLNLAPPEPSSQCRHDKDPSVGSNYCLFLCLPGKILFLLLLSAAACDGRDVDE